MWDKNLHLHFKFCPDALWGSDSKVCCEKATDQDGHSYTACPGSGSCCSYHHPHNCSSTETASGCSDGIVNTALTKILLPQWCNPDTKLSSKGVQDSCTVSPSVCYPCAAWIRHTCCSILHSDLFKIVLVFCIAQASISPPDILTFSCFVKHLLALLLFSSAPEKESTADCGVQSRYVMWSHHLVCFWSMSKLPTRRQVSLKGDLYLHKQ